MKNKKKLDTSEVTRSTRRITLSEFKDAVKERGLEDQLASHIGEHPLFVSNSETDINNTDDIHPEKYLGVVMIVIQNNSTGHLKYKAIVTDQSDNSYRADGYYIHAKGSETLPTTPVFDLSVYQNRMLDDQHICPELIEHISSHAHEALIDWKDSGGLADKMFMSFRAEDKTQEELIMRYIMNDDILLDFF